MVVGYNSRLKPSEIRFIQESIAGKFQDGSNVNDAVKNILIGRTSAEDFPPIKVVKKDGKWYSFDNRRLYMFRACEYKGIIQDIPVRVMPLSRLRKDKFTTENDGIKIRLRQGSTLDHYSEKWFRRMDDKGNENKPAVHTEFHHYLSRIKQGEVKTVSSVVSSREFSTPSLNIEPTIFSSATQGTPKLPFSTVINKRNTSEQIVPQEEYFSNATLNSLRLLHNKPTYFSSVTPATTQLPYSTIVPRRTTPNQNAPQENYLSDSNPSSFRSPHIEPTYSILATPAATIIPSWSIENKRSTPKRNIPQEKYLHVLQNEPTHLCSVTPATPKSSSPTIIKRMTSTDWNSPRKKYVANSGLDSLKSQKQYKRTEKYPSCESYARQSVRRSSSRLTVASQYPNELNNPCYPRMRSTVKDKMNIMSRSVAQDQFPTNSVMNSSESNKPIKHRHGFSPLVPDMNQSIKRSSSRPTVASQYSYAFNNPCDADIQKSLPYLLQHPSRGKMSQRERAVTPQSEEEAEVMESHEEPPKRKKSVFRRLLRRICCCNCDNE